MGKENLKIGILTFQRADNYGAALQCYALQRKVSQLCRNVEVIDYRKREIEDDYRIIPRLQKNMIRWTWVVLKKMPKMQALKERKKYFQEFRDKIVLSKSCDAQNFSEVANQYDIIFVGSDQLWNPDVTRGMDKIYYLDGVNSDVVKATYAMSMGSIQHPVFKENRFFDAANGFDYLSMREEDASQYLTSKLNREVERCVDPTLLIEREDWEALIKDIDIKLPEKYVLLYYVEYNEELIQVAKKVAADLQIPILYFDPELRLDIPSEYVGYVGPLGFLKLIQQSSVVATSSFHATVFSAIFRKNIYMLLHSKTGMRVKSVTQLFGIQDRIYNSYKSFEDAYKINDTLEYNDEKYRQEKIKSEGYLKRIIER